MLIGPGMVVIQNRRIPEAIPGLLLFAYVLAVVARNRTYAEVSEEGVVVRYGPLPTGEKEYRMGRDEIAEVYVRRVEISGRPKRVYWLAGVETKGGERVDIGEGVSGEAEAAAIVKALGWKSGIDRSDRRSARWSPMKLRVGLRLAAAAGLCGLWAAYV